MNRHFHHPLHHVHAEQAQARVAAQVFGSRPTTHPLVKDNNAGEVIADFVSENPPLSSYATPDVRLVPTDGTSPDFPIRVNDFDAGGFEYMMFEYRMHATYQRRGIAVHGVGTFSSATSSNARIEMAIMRLADGGDDWDSSHTFDWNGVTVAANGTSGKPTYFSVTFADGSDMDSLTAGETFILCVRRKHDHADDAAAGDFELKGCLQVRAL